jgi:hypothetical protein
MAWLLSLTSFICSHLSSVPSAIGNWPPTQRQRAPCIHLNHLHIHLRPTTWHLTISLCRCQSGRTLSIHKNPSHRVKHPHPTARTTASPTEESFFGAISARLRGRSRSRSRGATSRKRSKSPVAMPPTQAPYPQGRASTTSPTNSKRPAAAPVQNGRPSIQDAGRRSTSGSDPWKGRHSNDWLFNGYSLTASARELVQRRK